MSGNADLAGNFGGEIPEELWYDGHTAAYDSDDDFGVADTTGESKGTRKDR